jgi:zinc/manganese transport system substrate-binding protein
MINTIYKITLTAFTVITFVFASQTSAYAKVKVVTTIPDFGSIAKEIGGDKIEVKSIVKGYQNPHFVDAKPNYILWLNKADLLVYNGLDLEIGWLPVLITGSRNSKISSSDSVGHLNASVLIPNILEVPTVKVDRSMGDIHPGGNSHYMLDPRNGILIAGGIADRLKTIDPASSEFYEQNLQTFTTKLKKRIEVWEDKLEPFRAINLVTYHKSWVYFTSWAGFNEIGYVEPKPGIPPSPSHIAGLVKQMKDKNLNLILSESFYPQKTAKLLAEKTGAKLLVLPTMVDPENGVGTYSDLFDKIVNEITQALQN